MNRPDIRYRRWTMLVLGTLAVATGCAAGTAGSGGGGGSGSGGSDLITRDQIAELPEGTAFTVIQQARPRWLRTRSPGTLTSDGPILPVIFVDEQRYGPIDALHSIGSPNIEQIEFINSRDATTRYGTGYMGGIIHVHTRR